MKSIPEIINMNGMQLLLILILIASCVQTCGASGLGIAAAILLLRYGVIR